MKLARETDPRRKIVALEGAAFAIGHHYGTFQLTDEAIDAPAQALTAARLSAGIGPDCFALLRPGEIFEL